MQQYTEFIQHFFTLNIIEYSCVGFQSLVLQRLFELFSADQQQSTSRCEEFHQQQLRQQCCHLGT